jgi:tetratricopeptide (TPR) repeat protein
MKKTFANRIIFLLITFLFITSIAIAQKKKKGEVVLSDSATSELFSAILKQTNNFEIKSFPKACECIDSVRNSNPDRMNKNKAIAACIDDEVKTNLMSEQLMGAIFNMNKSKDKNVEINLNTNPNSEKFMIQYKKIEEWLFDSCASLKYLLATNDIDESPKSYSQNSKAIKYYNKGTALLRENNYKKAIGHFEDAVVEDSTFAFAWDNIGVCARHLEDYTKAEFAYKKSLSIDPKGQTPLQNLPIVYEMQEKYNEAIVAYYKLGSIYKDDPEMFYGIARIYITMKNYEKGLDNACKAYNLYSEQKSPYRSDAQNLITNIYAILKEDKKEELFLKILKENNINFQTESKNK